MDNICGSGIMKLKKVAANSEMLLVFDLNTTLDH